MGCRVDVTRGAREHPRREAHGATFEIDPCIPSTWPEYAIVWRYGRSRYEIGVSNPHHKCRGIARATLDGAPVDARAVPLTDDGATHRLEVVLG